jgi:hypothetical protein
MVYWLSQSCQEGAIVNLQKQSTPIDEQDENDPTLPARHACSGPSTSSETTAAIERSGKSTAHYESAFHSY